MGMVKVSKSLKITLYLQPLSYLLYHFLCSDMIRLSLIFSGNLYQNSGPNECICKFCHWNLESIRAPDNTKMSLIEVYSSVFNYNHTAVSDTGLDQPIENEYVQIEGFRSYIFRSNHPCNSRIPSGVCLY